MPATHADTLAYNNKLREALRRRIAPFRLRIQKSLAGSAAPVSSLNARKPMARSAVSPGPAFTSLASKSKSITGQTSTLAARSVPNPTPFAAFGNRPFAVTAPMAAWSSSNANSAPQATPFYPGPLYEFPFPAFESPKAALNAVFKIHARPPSATTEGVDLEAQVLPVPAEIESVKRSAFYVNDLGVVKRQFTRWTTNLPSVRPFYAMKCNPDPILVQLLANQGAGFDCASAAEIEQALTTGVLPQDIIFANPIKMPDSLKYAAQVGVTKMTFDNADELHKVKKYHPKGELVLRILADDSCSLMRFGSKFGCPFDQVEPLLKLAKELQLSVIGIAFHIGSGCFNTKAYSSAVSLARSCFDVAARVGHKFSFLDIGGGFPGDPHVGKRADGLPAFEDMARVLCESFDRYLPASEFPDLRIIGEPGRYFGQGWATLFTNVVGKREVIPAAVATPSSTSTSTAGAAAPSSSPMTASPGQSVPQSRGVHTASEFDTDRRRFLYYINDGVYGSFNCLIFDHAVAKPVPAVRFLTSDEQSTAQPLTSSPPLGTFFGPTCDSMDVVAKEVEIEELNVGDWVAFEHMGAYTSAAASRFNGIELPIKEYVDSLPAVPNTWPSL
jgi:ornithine decarboxylase